MAKLHSAAPPQPRYGKWRSREGLDGTSHDRSVLNARRHQSELKWRAPRTQAAARRAGYQRNREQWRKAIHDTVLTAAPKDGMQSCADEFFEVVVLLYLGKRDSKKRLRIHDVDNRLKDILDALQGRFGRSRSPERLIENDNRVYRVVMEKQLTPKNLGDDFGGKLMIRPYRQHRWPLQATKGHGLRRSTR